MEIYLIRLFVDRNHETRINFNYVLVIRNGKETISLQIRTGDGNLTPQAALRGCINGSDAPYYEKITNNWFSGDQLKEIRYNYGGDILQIMPATAKATA